VFEVSASGVETVLYSFNPDNGTDGHFAGALVVGENGGLYGTTSEGGSYGAGTIFEVDADGVETVLYSFNGTDGGSPNGLVVLGKKGYIYGTTLGGGAHYSNGYPGTVFRLNASRVEKVLYSFGSQSGDGYWPTGLIRDNHGNLYGTTQSGGANGAGTVFKVRP
jgi:uncharacterized repeat protein (TIGR03803 family)